MAMPVFAMSCFKLPKTSCDNLASAMADFWWNSGDQSSKIHWQSWEKLCLPKEKGGMGFRDIKLFNQALLAKQAWRILQDPDCLFARLMKSRYFENSDFLNASLGTRPSCGSRSIIHGRTLLRQGISKTVGNGKSMMVWTDPWIEDDGFRAPWRKNYFFDVNLRVADLLDTRTRNWDLQKLEENFYPHDIIRIRKIKPVMLQNDFYICNHNKNGDFSVKSAYWLASQNNINPSLLEASVCPSVNVLKQQVWELQTDPKLKVFLWKALSDSLPVAEALNGRGIKMDCRCQICDSGDESINPRERLVNRESSIKEPTKQSLKLFGKTVLISDSGISSSLTSSTYCKSPIQPLPRKPSPSKTLPIIRSSQEELLSCWIQVPLKQEDVENRCFDSGKAVQNEGSSTGSNSGSVGDTGHTDKKSEPETTVCQWEFKPSERSAFSELRRTNSESNSRGFGPYKKRKMVAEEEEEEEQEIHLYL